MMPAVPDQGKPLARIQAKFGQQLLRILFTDLFTGQQREPASQRPSLDAAGAGA